MSNLEEVNIQAMKVQFDQDLQTREEEGEKRMKQLVKQVCEMEVYMENEHRQHGHAFSSTKKFEMDFGELKLQVDCANKGPNDVLKQVKNIRPT